MQHLPFQKSVKVYPTVSDVTLALFWEQIDATFGYTVMKPVLDKMYPKSQTVFGPTLFSVPVGMVTAENSASTRAALNLGLIQVMRGGRYEKRQPEILRNRCTLQTRRLSRGSSTPQSPAPGGSGALLLPGSGRGQFQQHHFRRA